MPYYMYQAIKEENSCDYCKNEFEIMQSMQDQPLSTCPQCSSEVRKVIKAVGFRQGKKYLLTDKNIKKKGFTKLVNEGDGKFRKI